MQIIITLCMAAIFFSLGACSRNPNAAKRSSPTTTATETGTVNEARSIDGSLFLSNGLAGPIVETPCTLESGKNTTCLVFKRRSKPSDHKQGPWCPTKVSDGPEAGGIWPEGGVAHDVTGAFIENLATFYSDGTWAMYNGDGMINVTDSASKCAAAARPDVDPALHNHCVQCLPDYLPQDKVLETHIPKTPVKAAKPSPIRSDIGLALNGVEFAAPAPTHAILAAHTLAPFDDCGGHINMHDGYHYHAITSGCLTSVVQPDGHAPLLGYALDGFPIHARSATDGKEPTDLDTCRGHTDAVRGYHYHVSDPGENQIIGCFAGEIAQSAIRQRGGPRGGEGAGAPRPCSANQTSKCCGDNVCDGLESADNCPADC